MPPRRLSAEERVAFLNYLAREYSPVELEYDQGESEPVAIVATFVDDAAPDAARYELRTVGIGATLADALDAAAVALQWQAQPT